MASPPWDGSHHPLVSIIIPTYNRAEYLRQALRSVTAQTYPNWECIVVDDGSTDETETVVTEEFGERIRYRWQENAGPAVARNRGIEAAQSDLLLFLDSDDLLVPRALEHLQRHLREHPEAGVAYGGYYVLFPDGHLLTNARIGTPRLSEHVDRLPPGVSEEGRTEAVPYGLSVTGNILPELLQHDILLMGTALMRRSIVEAVEGFDSSLSHKEHWDLALRIAENGTHFVPIDRPVLMLRRHEGNRSRNAEASLTHRLRKIDKYLPEDDPDAVELRGTAYAHAYMECAMFLMYQDRVRRALGYLRRGLADSLLSLDDHIDDLDLITQKLCAEATAAEKPTRKLATLLEPFTGSSNRRAFQHFVWSRYWRMQTIRAGRSLVAGQPQTWGQAGVALARAGLSGLRLGAAVANHRGLARTYLERTWSWVGLGE